MAPNFPPGGEYFIDTFTTVPRPPLAGVNHTEPALSTSAPSSDCHDNICPGLSSISRASHSKVRSCDVLITQCEIPSPVCVTDWMCCMKRGKFSSCRQKE